MECGTLLTRHHGSVRCIWLLGLQSLLLILLVYHEMAYSSSRIFHCDKRVISGGDCMASIGQVSFSTSQWIMLQWFMSFRPLTAVSLTSCISFVFGILFNFWFTVSHIAGDSSTLADALSRNNVDIFLSQVPQAHQLSSRILPPLIDLLVYNITWTSTVWTTLFRATLQLL